MGLSPQCGAYSRDLLDKNSHYSPGMGVVLWLQMTSIITLFWGGGVQFIFKNIYHTSLLMTRLISLCFIHYTRLTNYRKLLLGKNSTFEIKGVGIFDCQLSLVMRKLAFCLWENKDADQLISAFVFAARIIQSFFYLNPKFQASSHLLWLYSLVCVGPCQKLKTNFLTTRLNLQSEMLFQ